VQVHNPAPDTHPLAVARLRAGELRDLVNSHRARVELKNGAEASQKWVDAVFSQGRQLAGAAPPGWHLAVQLEGSAAHVGEFWLLVRDSYAGFLSSALLSPVSCPRPRPWSPTSPVSAV
jgi:hypothetical protein